MSASVPVPLEARYRRGFSISQLGQRLDVGGMIRSDSHTGARRPCKQEDQENGLPLAVYTEPSDDRKQVSCG